LPSIVLSALLLLSSNLTVFVTYFSPFGVEHGVGQYVLVVARDDEGNSSSCFTDQDSSCTLYGLLSPNTVEVEAYYDEFNPWFHFECVETKVLDEAEEYLLVQCLRVYEYPIWLPHLAAPVAKE
jgi:hypothetical protein